MSVFRTKTALSVFFLALLSGSASAEISPLALSPAETVPVSTSTPTPEALGLALPPPPAPPAPIVITPPPVEASVLKDIKPDSIGLLTKNEGGLGASMWKGTSRAFVERFLPMLSLPMPYATLNNLAKRFLLTTAESPEGAADPANKTTLTSLRVEKLLALGHAAEAWALASLAASDQIGEDDLIQAAEMAMVSPMASDVCAKIPALVQNHAAIEWQKVLATCQILAKNPTAAQVSLDLMRAQDVHDEAFFNLADKIINNTKQPPHQLTPLKPLSLVLVRLNDYPLRAEAYARPDAPLIPELLKATSADEPARLALAERAAAKGLISDEDLADVYRSQTFDTAALAAGGTNEQGAALRALLYQAALQEKNPKNRIALSLKFMGSLDATVMGGSVLSLMGTMPGDAQPGPDFYEVSARMTKLYILAGNGEKALAWLALSRDAARGWPGVVADLEAMRPLMILAGLESEKDFAHDLDVWIDGLIKNPNADDADTKAQKATVGGILLLMDALGFPVTNESWAKVGDTALPEKTAIPPTLIMERLRSAAAANHKGEAILMGLLATNAGKNDPTLLPTLATIRALRALGLSYDAGNLAKDAALHILYPPAKP